MSAAFFKKRGKDCTKSWNGDEKSMERFDSDYMEGCHPRILQRMAEINFEKTTGYGQDPYCESAKEKIRHACKAPDAQIYFLAGGTQTKATVIAAFLRNYEGVIAAETGHINVHESGAIEAGGHKVIALPQKNGKLDAKDVEKHMEQFYADETWEHMVIPGMVYISHPTECGTLYTKAELEELRRVCGRFHMYLFMDGARLGYGLAADGTDVTLEEIARLCDVFYIGGTKVGALFGEAVVIPRPGVVSHFFTTIKQRGALLAKGWLLGLQFDTLFTDDLYFSISRNAVEMALMLKEGLLKKGYTLYCDSVTNQQFVILPKNKLKELKGKVTFSLWAPVGENAAAVRFATSWATRKEEVEKLLELM